MFNTVDEKHPAPVGKFSPKYFLHHRCWMLSEQDIYYEMLPFFNAVCAAIYIYIHVYQEARYACGKYAPKIHEDKLSIYFQDRPPTIVISGS